MHWINTSLNNTKIPEVFTAKCFHKCHNNKQFIPRVYMLINHKMTHRYIYFRFTRHALQLHHVTMLNRIEYVYLSIKDAHDRQYNYMKITIFTLIGIWLDWLDLTYVELPTWLQTFVLSKPCSPPNGNQMVIIRRTFKFVVWWHPQKPRKLVYHE
jgi:hypothetical protein